jgi:hypothetical protein
MHRDPENKDCTKDPIQAGLPLMAIAGGSSAGRLNPFG